MALNRHLRSASHSTASTSAATTTTATASSASATSTTSTVSASHATATASATASSTTTATREASSSTRSIIYRELGWTGFPIESCNGSPTETHFVTSLFPFESNHVDANRWASWDGNKQTRSHSCGVLSSSLLCGGCVVWEEEGSGAERILPHWTVPSA